jgi:ribonuclease BN (tRNA processing enzyme)
VAAAAGVSRLILVHFSVGEEAALIAPAARAFGGPVQRGCDWATFEI